jgi:hypothetical protein
MVAVFNVPPPRRDATFSVQWIGLKGDTRNVTIAGQA